MVGEADLLAAVGVEGVVVAEGIVVHRFDLLAVGKGDAHTLVGLGVLDKGAY